MIKIVTIIGARPQIIKAAAISRAVKHKFGNEIKEFIVHTGQHYDANMSQVFFDELEIPLPDFNLEVGSASHGKQTALMTEGIERLLLQIEPEYMLVYGDTNSTLAAGIAAAKIHIPVVHVEAGLRSFNKSMPEEINRIVCDHVSTLLFTPTETGLKNLIREGFSKNNEGPADIDHPAIYHCGDVMYDNTLHFGGLAEVKSTIIQDLDIQGKDYILATIHRAENTNDASRLTGIFKALDQATLQQNITVVLPLHPRTAGLLKKNLPEELYESVMANKNLKIIQPVSFLDMIRLEKHCRLILTDSGGVQKEAYFFKKPCVIARTETEWVEIVEAGAGIITDADSERIEKAIGYFLSNPQIDYKPIFGDGMAAEFICRKLLEHARGHAGQPSRHH